jgi:hypothetical protein
MRPIPSPVLPAAAALGAVLCIGSSASSQTVVPFQGEEHATAWPASIDDPGPFRRAVAGQFTPEKAQDVALIDGVRLALLANPDDFFAVSLVDTPILDLDRLRGAGAGGLDALATVGAAGLRRQWYDPSTQSFAGATIEAAAWAGAKLVRAADLNGDGLSDLIGIASDGQSVLFQLASGSATTFSACAGFSAQANVRDVVALQWDADQPLEVAMLTDLAIEVHEQGGALVNTFAGAVPGGTFCAIGQAGQTKERLVWITEYAPPAFQYLAVLTPAGVSDLVDLGSLDAFAVVPTDYDQDGDEDILISHRYSYELLWIENQRTPQNPNGATFTPAGDQKVFQVPNPGPAPQNAAWPVAADLDGDGDDDVAFANQGSLSFNVYRGEALDQAANKPHVTAAAYVPGLLGAPGTLTLTLAAPSSIPSGATHLEVRAWRRPSYGAQIDLVPVDTESSTVPLLWPKLVGLTLPETDLDFTDNYELQVRFVRKEQGAITAAYPSTVGAFGLLAADRTARLAAAISSAIDVLIQLALEPEQVPWTMEFRRVELPAPPPVTPSFALIPNFG